VLAILDAFEFPRLPAENQVQQELSMSFSSIVVSEEESHQFDKITRLQEDSSKWHAIYRERITASVSGDIAKRRAG
jgi:hypothetical protein